MVNGTECIAFLREPAHQDTYVIYTSLRGLKAGSLAMGSHFSVLICQGREKELGGGDQSGTQCCNEWRQARWRVVMG